MKGIVNIVFGIVCFGMTSVAFGQELSDREVGFDVARVTASLKEHGLKDQDINSEIVKRRMMYKKMYIDMKKREKEIIQITAPQQKIANTTNSKFIDIDPIEKSALQDFYNNTNGNNWTNHTGWDFNTPVTSWNGTTGWYGVTLSDDGNVTRLYLSANNLNGTIPDSFGNLKSLFHLLLDSNKLSGKIPASFGNFSSLVWLSLANNLLTGSIPSQLSGMINLTDFLLQNNQLTGGIPASLGALKKVYILNFYNNQLTGGIPAEIGSMTDLSVLNLSYNPLGGSIPVELGNLSKLVGIGLSNNQLIGSIPKEIFMRSKFDSVDLSYNKLTGVIPSEINNITYGSGYYYFQSNQLSGIVPIMNIDNATDIYVQDNKFRFIDLENIVKLFNIPTVHSDVSYSPQAKINVPEAITKATGQTVDLKMFPDGDTRYLNDDTYQWFKDGTAIAGATSRIYTIANLAVANAGVYTCKSYHTLNPDMSPLVLEREPITLTVSSCPKIIGQLSSYYCFPAKGNSIENNNVKTTCGNKQLCFSFDYNTVTYPHAIDGTYQWTYFSSTNVELYTLTQFYNYDTGVDEILSTPLFNFTIPGINTVQLVITEPNGCSTTFTTTVEIIACQNTCTPIQGTIVMTPSIVPLDKTTSKSKMAPKPQDKNTLKK
jgi:Leucine-rich repeat (LRR) protein